MTDLPPENVFAGSHTERAAHRRKDPEWLARIVRTDEAAFVPVCEEHTLVDPHSPRPRLLHYREILSLELPLTDGIFLGEHAGQACFALDCPPALKAPLGELGLLENIRRHATRLPAPAAGLLAYARAMVLWHRSHRYCPRCGAPTAPTEGGHMRACTAEACGTRQFPRLDPAIIVLVSHGDRCLLGRQPSWPPGRYSTIAGFVEPGEGLEDAVRREVYEETNIRVSNVRYHSSQPWPFPSSLMLGFLAEAENTDIRLNDQELEDAAWFTREQIAAQVSGAGSSLPMELSIAYRLIRHWFDGEQPGRLARLLRTGDQPAG
jgi:NAD+ diphosphatase